MADAVLTSGRIRGGAWQGILRAAGGVPTLEVVQGKVVLPGLTVSPVEGKAGEWALRVPIPVEMLSDGVQTFLLRDVGSGAVLGHFSIITGVAMEDDIRSELDLLRAELDMLKRAFRRHCLETMG